MNTEKQTNESSFNHFHKNMHREDALWLHLSLKMKLKLTFFFFILDQTSKLKSGGNGHTWPPETLLGCTTEQGTKNTKM